MAAVLAPVCALADCRTIVRRDTLRKWKRLWRIRIGTMIPGTCCGCIMARRRSIVPVLNPKGCRSYDARTSGGTLEMAFTALHTAPRPKIMRNTQL